MNHVRCEYHHTTSYETQVINCAKALIRAQKKSKKGLESSLKDEKCFFHMERLTKAIEQLEADEERVKTKRREHEDLKERMRAENRCELKSEICSGELVRRYKGIKADDPEFWACGACVVWFKRRGVRMRDISNQQPRSLKKSQKANAQKTKQTQSTRSKRPDGMSRSYRSSAGQRKADL